MKSVRLFNIPLKIDYSILPLVILNIYYLMNYVNQDLPLWLNAMVSIVATGLFFSSIILHELTHALVARTQGIRTIEMQLNQFGGYAKFAEASCTPLSEFKIAAAGPVSNLILGFLFLFCNALFQFAGQDNVIFDSIGNNFRLLGWINIILALFNLLPGMPMDGGIVLRAFLRNKGKDTMAATRIPVKIGIGLGYFFIAAGITSILTGVTNSNPLSYILPALWLLYIGYYLKREAEQVYKLETHRQSHRENWNEPGTVGEVMRTNPVSVMPDIYIQEFIDQILANNQRTIFPVARDERLHGILSLTRLRDIPKEKWNKIKVSEVMEPISSDLFVTVKSMLGPAIQKLSANSIGYLAVIDQDGYLIGDIFEIDIKHVSEMAEISRRT